MRIGGRSVGKGAQAIMFFGFASLVGLPWAIITLRPQNEFSYHLASGDPVELNEKNFSLNVNDNLFAITSGKIDAERSYVSGGFSDRFALVRLDNTPQRFAILMSQGPLFDRLVEQYEENVGGLLRGEQPLSVFLDPDDLLLTSDHKIDGRVLDVAKLSVYHKDKLDWFTETPTWIMDGGVSPSVEGLGSETAGLSLVLLILAILLGVPTVYVVFVGMTSKVEPLSVGQAAIVASRDVPINRDLATQRINEYLKSGGDEKVIDELGSSLGLRFVAFSILVVIGVVLLPTIVWTMAGLQSLLSAIRFEPFRDLSEKELREQLRFVVARGIIVNPAIQAGTESEGPGLFLATFEDELNLHGVHLSQLAAQLGELYAVGPQSEDDREVVELLHDDDFIPNRRRLLPERFASGHEIFLVDLNIESMQCQFRKTGCYTYSGLQKHVQVLFSVFHHSQRSKVFPDLGYWDVIWICRSLPLEQEFEQTQTRQVRSTIWQSDLKNIRNVTLAFVVKETIGHHHRTQNLMNL